MITTRKNSLIQEHFMKIAPMHDVPFKVAYTDSTAYLQLVGRLRSFLEGVDPDKGIAVVCLGTDRSTGDSLGPLVGSSLSKFHSSSFDLFGTLEEPVHAMNLGDTLEQLHSKICNPFIIGIDASLGQAASVGYIHVAEGPVRPGAGVKKELPPVGDIHISGVVNVGGFMEHYVLQNTRLHIVMRMAELISHSLFRAISCTLREHEEHTKNSIFVQNS
jgi:putative sporulation protein YyaC